MAADRKKWLESYPEDPGCRIEGHIYLSDFYDREAIETDKLVYLALKHRAEFITMRETQEQKNQTPDLLSAQGLFQICGEVQSGGHSYLPGI